MRKLFCSEPLHAGASRGGVRGREVAAAPAQAARAVTANPRDALVAPTALVAPPLPRRGRPASSRAANVLGPLAVGPGASWAALGTTALLEISVAGRRWCHPITAATAAQAVRELLRVAPRPTVWRFRSLGALRAECRLWREAVTPMSLQARHLRVAAQWAVIDPYEALCAVTAALAVCGARGVRLQLESAAAASATNPASWMEEATLQSLVALHAGARSAASGDASAQAYELSYVGPDVDVGTATLDAVTDGAAATAGGRLAGIPVVVTGATDGIGRALCEALVGSAAVVQTGRRLPSRPETWVPGVRARFNLDVTSDSDCADLAAHLAKQRVIVINNAGYLPPPSSADTHVLAVTREEAAATAVRLRQAVQVNALAPILLQLALERRCEVVRVVDVSSIFGVLPTMRQLGIKAPWYSVSKAVLHALAGWLNTQGNCAPVTLVHPGWCRTRTGGPGAPLPAAAGADAVLRALGRPPSRGPAPLLLQPPDQ